MLSSCIPRQTPSIGRSRVERRRAASASSIWSRSGSPGSFAGSAILAVAGGVEVAAAGEQQAVDRVERELGVVGVALDQRKDDRRHRRRRAIAST